MEPFDPLTLFFRMTSGVSSSVVIFFFCRGLFSPRQAIMEINPDHPVVRSLQASYNTQPDADSTKQTALLLYDIAALTGGYSIDDPNAFAQRVTGMLEDRIGADGAGGVKDAVVSEAGGVADAEVAAVEDAEEGGGSDAEVVG